MTLSTPFSQKLVQENTSQELSSLIQNQQLLMKSEPELTDNYSTLNNSSQEKKMLLITSPEVTTQSEKKLLIYAQTESENYQITAQDYKDSQFSTQLVEELDLDQDLYSQKDYQLIMVKNQNQVSQFIHLHKFQLQLLNHTTQFYQPTLYQNTLMSVLCWTMKLFMIFAEEIQILKDQHTLT